MKGNVCERQQSEWKKKDSQEQQYVSEMFLPSVVEEEQSVQVPLKSCVSCVELDSYFRTATAGALGRLRRDGTMD